MFELLGSLRHAPKSCQTYEPKVLIEMREWIGPALAPPDLCLTRRRACVGNVRARNGAVGRPMALSHSGPEGVPQALISWVLSAWLRSAKSSCAAGTKSIKSID